MVSKTIEVLIILQLKKYNMDFYFSENWIYSIPKNSKRQGWKIHVSCNLDNLRVLIKIVVPIIAKLKANFKIVRSYESLKELNNDIRQIGKVITIYSNSNANAINIVRILKPYLEKFTGPKIITDTQIDGCSILQYRYGSFSNSYIDDYGKQIDYILDKRKNKILDKRELKYKKQVWIKDPFLFAKLSHNRKEKSKLSKYKINKYLLKRNKLIYLGRYKKNEEVIIKQARINFKEGRETFQDEFLKNEFGILSQLNGLYGTPRPIELFEEEGVLYSVIEAIKSNSIYNYIENSYYSCNPLNDNECLFLVNEILSLLKKYHKKRLILGDINPNNIIIDMNGNLRFIDFEYSHFGNKRGYHAETDGFSPPLKFTKSDICNDLYCLISTIMFVATGRRLYLYTSKKDDLYENFVKCISIIRPTLLSELEKIYPQIIEKINRYETNG